MSELMPNKAFDTMQKLSSILHFDPTKEEDRAKFEVIAWDPYHIFLFSPFKILIDQHDFPHLKKKIKLVIANKETLENHKEAKELFLDKDDLSYKNLSISLERRRL